jgi:hypothetical protein
LNKRLDSSRFSLGCPASERCETGAAISAACPMIAWTRLCARSIEEAPIFPPPCAAACAQLGGGHIDPSSSSPGECEHSPGGDNASPTRPLAAIVFADQSRLVSRLCAAKTMESQKPGPRRAVKTRVAPAKRLGLDGEHGSGTPGCVHAATLPSLFGQRKPPGHRIAATLIAPPHKIAASAAKAAPRRARRNAFRLNRSAPACSCRRGRDRPRPEWSA